jgi:folate-dependent phosphoribosylglycinamide formyltransferase PurN
MGQARLVILASGSGSIAQSIIDAVSSKDIEESLHELIKIVERRLFVATLQSLQADHVRSLCQSAK